MKTFTAGEMNMQTGFFSHIPLVILLYCLCDLFPDTSQEVWPKSLKKNLIRF